MMTPSDIVRYTCVVQEGRDGWKGGAYVAEVLKRAVVVESWESWESEQVGLTTLVQSPDVITLTSWS